jgi:hypothetical protein
MSILPVTPAKPYHSRGFASIVVDMEKDYGYIEGYGG